MKIKDLFPIFKNDENLIYLDNASTTQKPGVVIDKLVEFYSKYNSNVHRGLYPLSEKATAMYDSARKIVADFIKANPSEVIFTPGTTAGVNMIANSLSNYLNNKTKVYIPSAEHHSNLVPWQQNKNFELIFLGENDIDWDTPANLKKIEPGSIFAFAHASNVTGHIADIKLINQIVPASVIKVVDVAQSIAHMQINASNFDILVFSGHKLYGPTGVGVLYINNKFQNKIMPSVFGGGIVENVEKDFTSFKKGPESFEAGTPPIAEAIALAESINFLNSLDRNLIYKTEDDLKTYMLNKLNEIDEITTYHSKKTMTSPLISFSVRDIHAHDIAQFLGEHNICVRAGNHCTHVLHKNVLQTKSTTRASIGMYNDKKDVDIFIEYLKKAIAIYSK